MECTKAATKNGDIRPSVTIKALLYYNLELGLGCNSDKDLSKNEGNGQLVRCKDTELYLHYIYLWTMSKTYVHNDIIYEIERRSQWESNAYYMRHWLIQPTVQLIIASYPRPFKT